MLDLARIGLCSLSLLVVACSGDDDGGGDDDGDGGGEVCAADTRYGDGTCNTDLACAEPDIDCFLTFESDDEAATWFASFEDLLADQEGRAPRDTLPTTDPRFQPMRERLDRAWDAVSEQRAVGDLAAARPALVLVDDPTINAFVIPDLDSGRQGFAVMVQTGLLEVGGSEAALLGLVMHEFEHALALHGVEGVQDRIRTFYVADGDEPLGFLAAEDPVARQHGEAWVAASTQVGFHSNLELGGMPTGGELAQVLGAVLRAAAPANPEGCTPGVDAAGQLELFMAERTELLGGALDMSDVDPELVRGEIDAILASLRDDCLAGLEDGFTAVVAGMFGVDEAELRAQMTAEDLALVDGVHVIDAIAALTLDRRARMQAAEEGFASASGAPWSQLRYYSFEEAADDGSVLALGMMGEQTDALADFLFTAQPVEAQGPCGDLLGAGVVPPYGVDLTDEHHATCWRVDHVIAAAASGELTPPASPRRLAKIVAPVVRVGKIVPRRLSDLVVY